MKPRLYLETSVVSYLTARPSHNLIRAAHQQITRDWWETRFSFDLYISQFVIDEAKAGDADAAKRRLSALDGAVLLELTPEAGRLAREILSRGGMPAKAYIDAVHVALTAVHGLDYLLTWNCTHIANATMRGKIEAICRAAGFEPPVICTPVELVKEL
ncbi:MAG TPA: type II toxin-antitoxin system VapC family toxin [Thermoanaerobaculia bacterium]|nr:type II toxin-antitoxin system VapC family toxin [Thermoanaerobaculia bacterium]